MQGYSICLESRQLTVQYCPHMVKGRKHQKVSCQQWTVKGFKILIKYYSI